MSYFKTKQWGQVEVPTGSTGAGTAPSMPNHGVSIISATSSEVYVLMPPVAGCEKTLVFTSLTTTVVPVVRLSTATGVVSLVGSTGNSIITLSAIRSTVFATVVTLKGHNSTSWILTGVCPASSTLTVNQGIVVSS